jgi:hypothetical protein
MKQSIKLYYLYCTNARCDISIYHSMLEIKIPFTAANLAGVHTCSQCKQQLHSAVYVDIKHMLTEADSGRPNNLSYIYN